MDFSVCRYCGSKKIKWKKVLQCGENAGWSYHYRAKCLECNKSYCVEHNNYAKKITENYNWEVSKTTKKHILKMIENKTLPKNNLQFNFDVEQLLKNSISYKNNILSLF
ncbi:hypothetical protein KA062_02850 [Patescibacteria group bacterium]|nr:hypothetical protein [Patescibacteria group bacterium]